MARKYPEGFYVYLHRRKSDGLIFYVGKGSNGRAWQTSRSDWWHSVVNKHGFEVLIYKDGMTSPKSLELEVMLISIYREIGYPLVNLTDGGEGACGVVPFNVKLVHCSNGMSFSGCYEAAEWVRRTSNKKARHSLIASCCRRVINSAYEFSWWYDGDAPKKYVSKGIQIRNTQGVAVNCSNGMRFDSGSSAAEYLVSIGIKTAKGSHIFKCCGGGIGQAYGFSWWYDGREPMEYIPRYVRTAKSNGRKVMCSNGMIFDTQGDAARWLRNNGFPKAGQANISASCLGKYQTSCGYTWKYADEKN